MGSDLALVDVRTNQEHSREQALSRLSAYGLVPEGDLKSFFAEEGPYLEMRLHLKCVHPDAPLDWGWLFLTRLVDEGVYHAARGDSSGYDFEKTPLFEKYPNLWKMEGPRIQIEPDSPVRVVEVKLTKNPTPREGDAKDPYGDTLDVAFFIHKKWAPNLGGYSYWESRAWGGGEYATRRYPTERPPIPAPIRAFSSTRKAVSGDGSPVLALAPRPLGGVWAATQTLVFTVPVQGDATVHVDGREVAPIAMLASAPDGSLWVGGKKGLLHVSEDGARRFHEAGEHGLGKKVLSIAVTPENVTLLGTEKGLHILGADGQWTLVKDGLAAAKVERIVPQRGGVVWLVGDRKLTRRSETGALDKFMARQGVEGAYGVAPNPRGGAFVSPYYGPVVRIEQGSSRAEPDETMSAVATSGIQQHALSPDGALWCTTGRGNLVAVPLEGPPRVYLEPARDTAPAEIVVSPEQALWIRDHNGKLSVVPKEALDALDAAPPINADILAQVKAYLPREPKKEEAPPTAVDLRGKSVVITGTLSKLTREQALRALERKGALSSESVTRKTDYLIVGLKPSSKLQKAQKLGIPVLTEDVLLPLPETV